MKMSPDPPKTGSLFNKNDTRTMNKRIEEGWATQLIEPISCLSGGEAGRSYPRGASRLRRREQTQRDRLRPAIAAAIHVDARRDRCARSESFAAAVDNARPNPRLFPHRGRPLFRR